MAEQATELKLIGGLFRNTSKKGDVYYSGKGEDGTQYVLLGTHIGRKAQRISPTSGYTRKWLKVVVQVRPQQWTDERV